MAKLPDNENLFTKIMEANTGTNNNTNGQQTQGKDAADGLDNGVVGKKHTATTYITDNNKKYLNPQQLKHTQVNPAIINNNTMNFKQDYVVIIRKKLFYAATSFDKLDEQRQPILGSGEENYLRMYQVNNFMSLNTSHNVYGRRPGSCSITIRGGERVVAAEKSQQEKFGWGSIGEMIMGWLNVDEDGMEKPKEPTEEEKAAQEETKKEEESKGFLNTAANYLKNVLGGGFDAAKQGTKWTVAKDNWANAAAGTDFKNLLKAREAKYGWKFAEKCDWEPMDEIYIFAKSKIDIDYENHCYKMNQIFFGYIDSIEKTYQADKGGLLIRITATDHLKLLDLSRMVTTGSILPGKFTGGGLQIDWVKDDFGMLIVQDPWQVLKDKSEQESGSTPNDIISLQQTGKITTVFSATEPHIAIFNLCFYAGIPLSCLHRRIEPIVTIPFLPQLKEGSNGDLCNAEMKKRIDWANEIAEKMFMEFFADEEGNIVFKVPNYAYGANRLWANNSYIKGLEYDPELLDAVFGTFKLVDTKPEPEEVIMIGSLNRKILGKEKGKFTEEEYVIMNRVLKIPLTDKDAEDLQAEIDANAVNIKDYEDKAKKEPEKQEWQDLIYVAKEQDMVDRDTLEQHKKLRAENDGKQKYEYYTPDGQIGLWELAIKHYGTGEKYTRITKANPWLVNDMGDLKQDLCDGMPQIKIPVGPEVQEQSRADYQKMKEEMAKAKAKNFVQTNSGKTLSELTDQYIQTIEDKYIVSFTLRDTDREIFNMFEINLETPFKALQDSQVTQIRRAVPDLKSIIQFGMRPHPGTINTPFITNEEDAKKFGYMMIARSLAGRYSGTLTMIEDSSIKVGNPIRFHIYDEHPFQSTGLFTEDAQKYAKTQASYQQEYPEAVFYVTAIDRTIDVKGVSHMTLHLNAGRMMGQESIFDVCLPLYKWYYYPMNAMTVSSELVSYYDYYHSQSVPYYPTQNDSISTLIKQYVPSGTELTAALRTEILNAILSMNQHVFGRGANRDDATLNSAISLAAKDNVRMFLPAPGSIRTPQEAAK